MTEMGIDGCIETTSLTHRQLAERFASLEAELTDANAKMNEATSTVYRLQDEQKKLRLSNPDLDRILVDWYGFSPANRITYMTGVSSPELAASIYNNSSTNSIVNALKVTGGGVPKNTGTTESPIADVFR